MICTLFIVLESDRLRSCLVLAVSIAGGGEWTEELNTLTAETSGSVGRFDTGKGVEEETKRPSRTVLAISWVYCEPKSRIKIFSVIALRR